ncbi:MAG: hypothetical protein CUN49_13255 [Candidatus Thermofonsia Clade 1 bacterium]|jgi:hypothetical protein|uniref:Uncharacterized protein n=1 Tax=Candidatus Thermofonsia Clade 1 bacterium TaxID=2364210 RepID=A0A2M8PBJ4_9CHLR|nr:MAG: hypothetical protein CUN49_13255 [Candidatus Thermofonsia Clade 1 bacterium]RMF52699.1 MAG: hypothetical protein D6749_04230 [Chloroflexota bacterium]
MFMARQVGAQAPDSSALAWLKGLYQGPCTLPKCWQGIQIGEMSVRQAVDLLQANSAWRVEVFESPYSGAWVVRSYHQAPPYGIGVGFGGAPDTPLVANTLWIHLPEGALRIGEVIAALGAPNWAWQCRVGSPTFYRLGAARFMAQSSYSGRFSPQTYVMSISVSTSPRRDEPPWQGFTYRTGYSAAIQRACR